MRTARPYFPGTTLVRKGHPTRAGYRLGYRAVTPTRRFTLTRTIRDIPRPERKGIDGTFDVNPVPTAGSLSATFLNLSEGTLPTQRIGRKITLRVIQIRGFVTLNESVVALNATDVIRIMVIHDKCANKAMPAITDILASATWRSFMNLSNVTRFRVLWTKFIHLDATAGAGDGLTNCFTENTVFYSGYIKVNIPVLYTGTGGGIANIVSSNVFALAITTRANTQINMIHRVRYTG